MKQRVRGLLLAAGRGERLRPLTRFVPKPLLPVAGRPVAAYSLDRLAAVGCEAVALNLHHLGEEIERELGDRYAGMPITYSREAELLGTAGALRPLREFLAPADLIVLLNGDSLCHWPLRRLIRTHVSRGAAATLLLTERAAPRTYGSGVSVDEKGRVVAIRSHGRHTPRRHVFAGAHVLEPRLLTRLGQGMEPGDIVTELYEPLLDEGELLQGVVSSVRWHDLGTPRRYLDGACDFARGRWPWRLFRRRFVARGAVLAARARVRGSVVESGARVGARAQVEHTLVLGGAEVGDRAHVVECIIAPGVRIPDNSRVERRLVTPLKAGRDPGASDSVLGQLVYTPIARRS